MVSRLVLPNITSSKEGIPPNDHALWPEEPPADPNKPEAPRHGSRPDSTGRHGGTTSRKYDTGGRSITTGLYADKYSVTRFVGVETGDSDTDKPVVDWLTTTEDCEDSPTPETDTSITSALQECRAKTAINTPTSNHRRRNRPGWNAVDPPPPETLPIPTDSSI